MHSTCGGAYIYVHVYIRIYEIYMCVWMHTQSHILHEKGALFLFAFFYARCEIHSGCCLWLYFINCFMALYYINMYQFIHYISGE